MSSAASAAAPAATSRAASAAPSAGGASGATTITGGPTGQYAKGITIAIDTLQRSPLGQNEAAGAMAAAAAAGATVKWIGPADLNPTEAIKDMQDAGNAGVKGEVVSAYPGDLFKVPIDGLGIPVTTIDLYSPGSKAATHFAPDKYELGVAMATEIAKALGANATGTVIAGICVPGLPALVAPQQGFIDTMKKLQPGVTIKANTPVDGDPTKNYGSWQRIISQNPTAIAFVGQCDQDTPNLIKLKTDSKGAKWLIASTSGDSAANIAAVKSGIMTTIISQNGWPEGYLSAALLLQNIAKGTPLPKGWIDTGLTTITAANADEVTAREKNPALNATVFAAAISKVLADPQAATKDYTGCRGCGTTFKP
ncbi:hypothetical protein acdb102_31710 [Acidothermaceae bacterium B102]|nr:hypothetical protein acdb102_31710 [Acidothermaceae bacterium B102]